MVSSTIFYIPPLGWGKVLFPGVGSRMLDLRDPLGNRRRMGGFSVTRGQATGGGSKFTGVSPRYGSLRYLWEGFVWMVRVNTRVIIPSKRGVLSKLARLKSKDKP